MGRGELPELAAEVGLLLGGEVLVPEEDDQMTRQGGPSIWPPPRIERGRQIEAADLGPDDGRQGPYVEAHSDGHGTSLHPTAAYSIHGPASAFRPSCPRLADRGR